jgi:hypothetical protein
MSVAAPTTAFAALSALSALSALTVIGTAALVDVRHPDNARPVSKLAQEIDPRLQGRGFCFARDRIAATHPPGLCRKARYLSVSSNAR